MAVNGDGVHAAQRGSDGERAQAAARPRAYALDDAWIYKVAVLADLVASRVLKAVQSVSSLNLSQWRVLAALADKPGRTASEVVAITPMDKAIVSRAAASLVDQGLVERRASATDGRVSH